MAQSNNKIDADLSPKLQAFERYAFIFELIIAGALNLFISISGPLILNVINYRTNLSSIYQVMGNDLITLILVTPAIFLSVFGWLKYKKFTKYLLLGTGSYQVYTYLTYVIGIEYSMYSGNNEQFFFIFVYLVITAYINAAIGFKQFIKEGTPMLSRRGSRIMGILIMLFGIIFAMLWISQIVEVILTGDVNNGLYTEIPNGFWTIRTFDMAWSIPIMFFSAYLMITRTQSCYNIVIIFLSFGAFFGTAPFSMAVIMYLNNDPFTNVGELFFMGSLMTVVWIIYIWFVNEKEHFIQ